jgi:hypothetical protein
MSLRPPSHQKHYDAFYSGDSAFEQPAAEATDAQKEAHARRVKIARETGNWAALLVPQGNPTKFVMRPIPGTLFRTLVDRFQAGKYGVLSLQQMLFRAALIEVVNLGDAHEPLTLVTVEGLGPIAPVEIADKLDSIDPGIVRELGDDVFRRATVVAPKS